MTHTFAVGTKLACSERDNIAPGQHDRVVTLTATDSDSLSRIVHLPRPRYKPSQHAVELKTLSCAFGSSSLQISDAQRVAIGDRTTGARMMVD